MQTMNTSIRTMIRLLPTALICLLASACAAPQGMLTINGGTFHMGTDRVDEEMEALGWGLPEPWYADEHPFHPVNLARFHLDVHEVTNAEYQLFVDANSHISAPDDWARKHHPRGKADHPVVYVSWQDAQHYCHWRGARLPTEAEWEAAARGEKMNIYPWGNSFNLQNANVSSGPFDRGRTRAVGSTPAGNGPYGHQDLIGNVWEWVDANYKAYPGSTDEVDGFSEGFKVMRGLSFESVGHFMPQDYAKVIAISARASFRGYDHPGAKLRDVGFRCAAPRPEDG